MSDNNNNYSNFNGYQTPQQSGPVVYLTPDQVQDNVAQDKKKANTLGVWSIVLGVLSCCCCGLTSIVGVILAIVGLGKDKKNVACIVGLILGGLSLVYIAYSFIYNAMHPEQYNELLNQFMETYSNAYSQASSSAYGAILPFLF